MKLFIIIIILSLVMANCWANSVISIAMSQIGYGETAGNNKGLDIRKYLKGNDGKPWCAGFVSYVLKQAEIKTFPYYFSAISYYETAKDKGLLLKRPKIGDLVVFWRIKRHPLVYGHIGIVTQVLKDSFISIEGNVGNYPAKVKKVYHNFSEKNILGYIRIK